MLQWLRSTHECQTTVHHKQSETRILPSKVTRVTSPNVWFRAHIWLIHIKKNSTMMNTLNELPHSFSYQGWCKSLSRIYDIFQWNINEGALQTKDHFVKIKYACNDCIYHIHLPNSHNLFSLQMWVWLQCRIFPSWVPDVNMWHLFLFMKLHSVVQVSICTLPAWNFWNYMHMSEVKWYWLLSW